MFSGPTSNHFIVRGRYGELWIPDHPILVVPPTPREANRPTRGDPALCFIHPHILHECPARSRMMALGKHHWVVVDGEGHVWGQGTLLPSPFPQVPIGEGHPWVRVPELEHVTQVACGLDFTMTLTDDGEVWSFASTGDGSFQGQLGLNNKNRPGPRPTRVLGLPPVRRLACGASFTVVEDEEGQLWAWGDNNSGQLGRGDFHQELKPCRIHVPDLPPGPLRSVAAGGDFTVLVDAEGFAWASGQLNYEEGDQPTFKQVEGPRHLVKVIAGGFHTLALDEEGRVWGWGMNQDFALGGGRDSPVYQTPTLLSLEFRVVDVAAGLHFSLLQTEADELFYLGMTEQEELPPYLPRFSSIQPMLMADRMKRPKSAKK